MSDSIEPVSPETTSPSPTCDRTRTNPWLLFVFVVVVLGCGLAGGAAIMNVIGGVKSISVTDTSLPSKLEALDARLHSVEAKLATSSEVVATEGGAPVVAVGGGQDIEKLKAGLAGLSGALSLLQTEIEKSSKVSNEARMNTRTGLATVLGYLQLQRAALNGQQFEKERQDLRKVAEGDQTLVDLLIKLEPYALTGVPQTSMILTLWSEKTNEAQTALRKAGAQTWIDRVLVALEGLVSIRSLNPSASQSLAFDAIEMDLRDDKLKNALDKITALPSEVQSILVPCQKKIETRLAVEGVLDEMSSYLMTRGAQAETKPESAIPQDEGTK